ncbi:DUF6268 family outer membrane beta-barrel protein [Botryobacter ruber]|uniref:DUF6268 family outer membrane beta-barrel protein n=1 Tax=Botryobacter ruber TaxID=2171629 RepID=UPI000E0C4AAB|nr:DUF6268 family outer membrane beta-barrel protein [Botryobacter ruber]
MKKYFTLIVALPLLLLAQQAKAQQRDAEEAKTILYASPSVEGMGKGRGIVVGYERLPQFDIESESSNSTIGNGSGHVRRNNVFDARIILPVLNKPQNKLLFGVSYNLEEYDFTNVQSNVEPFESYSLYSNLHDKDLKSLGAQAAFLHSVNEQNFYLVRVKGELNGDYTNENVSRNDYLKTSVDLLYGWKKSPNYVFGIGLQWGYTFGRRRIFPAAIYNRTFNDRWGIEAIVPANLRVRRNVSEKTLLYAGYKLDGASYNMYVKHEPLSSFDQLELRRTDLKLLLRLEQEIYDFLWFSVEGGYRHNFRYNIYDDIGTSGQNYIIKSDLAGTGYVGVELFVVPPRKFSEKNK